MVSFKSYAEYQSYKSDNDQCYIDGCTCNQTESTRYCEEHYNEEGSLFHECSSCDVPVPYNSDYCKYHGGKNYTNALSKKLKALYEDENINVDTKEDNSYVSKLKSDAIVGLKGAALSTFISNSRKIILSTVQKLGVNGNVMKMVSDFLESSLGEILYKYGISIALDAMAGKTSKIDLEAIASQLRQQATQEISEEVFEMLLPSVFDVLASMTEPEKKKEVQEVKQIENLTQNRVTAPVTIEQTESVSV